MRYPSLPCHDASHDGTPKKQKRDLLTRRLNAASLAVVSTRVRRFAIGVNRLAFGSLPITNLLSSGFSTAGETSTRARTMPGRLRTARRATCRHVSRFSLMQLLLLDSAETHDCNSQRTGPRAIPVPLKGEPISNSNSDLTHGGKARYKRK